MSSNAAPSLRPPRLSQRGRSESPLALCDPTDHRTATLDQSRTKRLASYLCLLNENKFLADSAFAALHEREEGDGEHKYGHTVRALRGGLRAILQSACERSGTSLLSRLPTGVGRRERAIVSRSLRMCRIANANSARYPLDGVTREGFEGLEDSDDDSDARSQGLSESADPRDMTRGQQLEYLERTDKSNIRLVLCAAVHTHRTTVGTLTDAEVRGLADAAYAGTQEYIQALYELPQRPIVAQTMPGSTEPSGGSS